MSDDTGTEDLLAGVVWEEPTTTIPNQPANMAVRAYTGRHEGANASLTLVVFEVESGIGVDGAVAMGSTLMRMTPAYARRALASLPDPRTDEPIDAAIRLARG